MDEVARLADQLVLMDQGRELAAGPLAALLARTDLPLAREDDAGVVVQARVAERDAAHGLARVTFDGGALWVGDAGLRPGARARVRVLARDVSVAREAPLATSILNVLPVRLLGWQLEGHTVLLRLAAPQPPGAAHLLARITRRSHEALQLQAGEALFAQVKGAALMQ
jgi:molybdate transport system ATP-binding protein